MKMILILLVVVAGFAGSISKATARCSWTGRDNYRPERNDTVNVQMTCDLRGIRHEGGREIPGDGYFFTGIHVLSHGHNGTMRPTSLSTWEYIPKSPGPDSFSFKICATLYNSVSGCTTMNYQVTNQRDPLK
jgi:hypothetical protein